MTNENKRRATLPIELVEVLVPWVNAEPFRAIGCLRIEPGRLIATTGHRMVTVAPPSGRTWCAEAFSVPRGLLVDAIAVARAPGRAGDPNDNLDRALAGKPPVDAALDSLVVELPDAENARSAVAELAFSNGHKVRLTTDDPVDSAYPNVDMVLEPFYKSPGNRGASAEKYVSLNPSFLVDCYAILKQMGWSEIGVTLTGWSDDPRAPIFLQSIDRAHQVRFALMGMNVTVDAVLEGAR